MRIRLVAQHKAVAAASASATQNNKMCFSRLLQHEVKRVFASDGLSVRDRIEVILALPTKNPKVNDSQLHTGCTLHAHPGKQLVSTDIQTPRALATACTRALSTHHTSMRGHEGAHAQTDSMASRC